MPLVDDHHCRRVRQAHDEVVIELNARTVANHGLVGDGNRFPALFGDSALGMPGGALLTTYWTAFVIKTFWQDEFAIRGASVLIGVLNIGLMCLPIVGPRGCRAGLLPGAFVERGPPRSDPATDDSDSGFGVTATTSSTIH